MAGPNTDKKSKHVSDNKIAKFILLLIAIGTIRWVSSTTTSLSSISSFIQSSGKGSKITKIFDRKQPRQTEETTLAATVILIHYHKTGNNFIVDLLTEIDKTHRQHRHDLTMKDTFVLNREFKKAEERRRSEVETLGIIPNGDGKGRRRLRDHKPRKKRRKAQSKKRGSNNGSNDGSTKAQSKKMGSNGGETTGKPKRDVLNRNKGQEAKIQDEARKADSKEIPKKRAHDPLTGCPHMGEVEFEIGAAYRLTAPDLFCNLSLPVEITTNTTNIDEIKLLARHDGEAEVDLELDGMKKQEDSKPGSLRLPFPPWERTKIVHFVRDPFDMALSNYLYHSQHPTPEAWVLARHLNPCVPNNDLINYTLAEWTNVNKQDASFANITQDDLLQVSDLCRYYRRDHPMGTYKPNMTKAFYSLLRYLPPYDGLRVATTQFLLAHNPQSGGDLLRMSNNILRLGEWEADGLSRTRVEGLMASSSRQQSHILTVSMGNIVKDMNGSIQDICNFIMGHISNSTIRSELAQDIADAMVAMYTVKEQASKEFRAESAKREQEEKDKMITSFSSVTMRTGSHVTQGLMNATDRQLLKKQLEEDPILGSIMLQLREIVNAAGSGR